MVQLHSVSLRDIQPSKSNPCLSIAKGFDDDHESLGANPYLPTRYVLSSLWVLNQNTQHRPTRSI